MSCDCFREGTEEWRPLRHPYYCLQLTICFAYFFLKINYASRYVPIFSFLLGHIYVESPWANAHDFASSQKDNFLLFSVSRSHVKFVPAFTKFLPFIR